MCSDFLPLEPVPLDFCREESLPLVPSAGEAFITEGELLAPAESLLFSGVLFLLLFEIELFLRNSMAPAKVPSF